MAIEYTWKFPQFNVVPSEDGLTNIVASIGWIYTGTDGEYTASYQGQLPLSPPNPSNFIPYDELTEKWAIEQVTAYVELIPMQENIIKEIERQKKPATEPLPPPFPQ